MRNKKATIGELIQKAHEEGRVEERNKSFTEGEVLSLMLDARGQKWKDYSISEIIDAFKLEHKKNIV